LSLSLSNLSSESLTYKSSYLQNHLTDGDSQECSWVASKRHGPSIFYAANGEIEYSSYNNDEATGSGVTWTADRTKAYKLVNGKKGDEISLGMAENIAEEFGLEVPKKSDVKIQKRLPKSGLMTRMFASSYVDGNGNLRFKDYGSWGTYVGDIDDAGKREGKGKISYDQGGFYDGEFKNNKFEGNGTYVWDDGESYEGEWKDGERNGKAIFRSKDGTVQYQMFEAGKPSGEGVSWTADRKTAHKITSDDKKLEMLLEEAEKFAMEKFNLPVPEVSDIKVPPVQKSVGLFARLFGSGPVFDNEGNPMFKDNGDWGTWSGEVDSDTNRKGFGRMTYESGSVYEGCFMNNVYEDDTGKSKYTWSDGEYYLGQWKNGEREGKGVYYAKDGTVEYSMYEGGHAVGMGIKWSADRKSAFRLTDGKETIEISYGVAQKESKEKFDLPVPEVSAALTSPAQSDGKASQPGLFQRIFKGAPPLDEEGNPMFRDNSDWCSYVGDRDANGHRSGKGKVTNTFSNLSNQSCYHDSPNPVHISSVLTKVALFTKEVLSTTSMKAKALIHGTMATNTRANGKTESETGREHSIILMELSRLPFLNMVSPRAKAFIGVPTERQLGN
jgi:hypothetical protein